MSINVIEEDKVGQCIHREETSQNIQRCIKNLDEKHSQLSDMMANKKQNIGDHYELTRYDIYSTTQNRIDELNKLRDKLILEVDEKENNSLEKILDIESKNEKLMNDLNERLDKLKDECENNILKPSARPTESQLDEILRQFNELSKAFSEHTLKLKNLLYLNIHKVELAESELTLSISNIGNLVSKQVKTNLVDINSIQLSKRLIGHDKSVTALAVSPDGTLVSGTSGGYIKMWNTSSGECIRTLIGHWPYIKALKYLLDGTLVSGAYDFTIKMWNTSTGECIKTITRHLSDVHALEVLPDGTLVSANFDNEPIMLWNTSTGKCIKEIYGHGSWVLSLLVLPDGTLVSGLLDGSIKLWNTSTRRCQNILRGHTNWVQALALLSDGRLASGSFDQTIKLWNTSTGECIRTLIHNSAVVALAVLLDGTLVSSSDETIKMWNTSTGECLKTLSECIGEVLALAVLPDGTLVSGSSDETIILWSSAKNE